VGVITFAPKFVDEQVSRGYPCTAWRGDGGERCGTTPTRHFRKMCRHNHNRDVWLCSTHEAMTKTGASSCKECADRGGFSFVIIMEGGA
jgi:hypothetical protein